MNNQATEAMPLSTTEQDSHELKRAKEVYDYDATRRHNVFGVEVERVDQ